MAVVIDCDRCLGAHRRFHKAQVSIDEGLPWRSLCLIEVHNLHRDFPIGNGKYWIARRTCIP